MNDHRDNRGWRETAAPALALAAAVTLLTLISPRFNYNLELSAMPIPIMVGALMAAGVAYLGAWRRSGGLVDNGRTLGWIVAVGILLRLIMLPSTPMLEDDFYRYLWDGAVSAHGINPYRWSPAEALAGGEGVPAELAALAREAGETIERVNHPRLKTIYPLTAQFFFAAAYYVAPFSLTAWKLTLLALDLATLYLLLILLKDAGLPGYYCLLYFWNPLLIKEFYNSAHMDLTLLPFIAGAAVLAGRRRWVGATTAVALAAGSKVWPIILLPVVLRGAVRRPRVLIPSVLVFGLIVAAMAVPIYLGGLGPTSGFTAYGERWEMNDALFMVILWVVKGGAGLAGMNVATAEALTRLLMLMALAAIALWMARREAEGARELAGKVLVVVAAMYLLSPTQFPWYYLWVFPLLAVRPRWSLLILTALLPLYYLRFYLRPRGLVAWFDYGVVFFEFAPVWALLLLELRRSRRGSVG